MKFKTLITPEGKYLSVKHDRTFYLVEVCVPELYPFDFNFEGVTDLKPTSVELIIK